jgi:hypothetical protein
MVIQFIMTTSRLQSKLPTPMPRRKDKMLLMLKNMPTPGELDGPQVQAQLSLIKFITQLMPIFMELTTEN